MKDIWTEGLFYNCFDEIESKYDWPLAFVEVKIKGISFSFNRRESKENLPLVIFKD